MRHSWRLGITSILVAAAAAATGCQSCARGGGGAREDLATLPQEAQMVVRLNVARLRDTTMWRKILDLRDGNAESKKKYDDFVAQSGLDPFLHIDSVMLGFPSGDAASEGEFGALVHGKFDEQKLVAWAKDQAKKDGHELVETDYNGKKLYNDRDSGQMFVCIYDAHLVMAGGPTWIKKMVDLAAGKKEAGPSAQDNQALQALIAKTKTGDAVWGVGVVPESVRQRLEGNTQLESAKSLKDIYGSIDFATGLSLLGTFDLGSEADAKQLSTKLGEQLTDAKKNPQIMMMGLAQMLDAIQLSTEGAAFKVNIKYNQQQVEQLIERLQGLLKAVGGGGVPGMGPGGGMPGGSLPGLQ